MNKLKEFAIEMLFTFWEALAQRPYRIGDYEFDRQHPYHYARLVTSNDDLVVPNAQLELPFPEWQNESSGN